MPTPKALICANADESSGTEHLMRCLAIRADASHQGGIGHIMRTLAIAQEWLARGGRCLYLTCSLPENLHQRLIDEGFEIIDLGENEDLHETAQILSEIHPHWLLIDGYHLDSAYQSQLLIPEKTKRAVISDFGPQDWYEPECIIHSNIIPLADGQEVPDQCKLLSGPQYILIRKELRRNTTQATPTDSARKILISMGGSDPLEAAYTLIQTIDLADASYRVILGPAYPSDGKLRSLNHPAIELIDRPPSLAPHYAWADTGITTPSTTSLEMAHHGLPMGLVTIADNQYHIRDAFIQLKAALPLADLTSTDSTISSETLDLLLTSSEKRAHLASAALHLVDGNGSSRICDALDFPLIHFTRATLEDAQILWEWTNDPLTREQSFSSNPIPWEEHLDWFSQSLDHSKRILLIVRDSQRLPLGQIRFDEDDDENFVISFSLAPQARGLGLAPYILDRACSSHLKEFPGRSIIAWIKPSNRASLRTFYLAKFREEPIQPESDRVKFRR